MSILLLFVNRCWKKEMAKEMQFIKEAEFDICQVSMSCVTDIKYNRKKLK